MTEDRIRKDAMEFVKNMATIGHNNPDQLTEQSKVCALYEIAAQLAKLNAKLDKLERA